jgi:hypothetical protein
VNHWTSSVYHQCTALVQDQLYFPSYTALVRDLQLPNKSQPLLSLTSDYFLLAFVAIHTKASVFIAIPLDFIEILRD